MEKSEAPSINAYVINFKSTPAVSAAPMAIGYMRAAAALLVTNELIKAVAKYTAPYRPASVINQQHRLEITSHLDPQQIKKEGESIYLQVLNLDQQ